MKKRDIVLIVSFITIITLPGILYFIIGDKMDKTNYQNRALYEKPKLSINTYTTYSKDFENYYYDVLPFKNEILKLRSTIKYNIFNSSTSEKVIVGKDNWLFYNSGVDGLTDEIGEYRKTTRFTEDEYNLIASNLNSLQNKMDKEKIDFHLLIAPNKSTVYPEYMPDLIKRDNSTENNKTEELINVLKKETNVSVLYPKQQLLDGKKYSQTYFRFDTHWNGLGGFIGSLEMIRAIDGKDYNLNNYKYVESKNTSGDLAIMNITPNFGGNTEPHIVGYNDEVKSECTYQEDIVECFSSNAPIDKTILLIGDSFRTAMQEYLFRTYKHVIILYVPFLNSSYIEKYKPNSIVYEVVERNNYQLFTIAEKFGIKK